ncbi:MAG TPA: hypothetical protein VGG16_20535 [Streptosporangiaceae bacterium]|jgi:hypothetical protein
MALTQLVATRRHDRQPIHRGRRGGFPCRRGLPDPLAALRAWLGADTMKEVRA